jgi:hypothetical protein
MDFLGRKSYKFAMSYLLFLIYIFFLYITYNAITPTICVNIPSIINSHFQPSRPPIPDIRNTPKEINPENAEANDWIPQNHDRRVASSFVLYHPVR